MKKLEGPRAGAAGPPEVVFPLFLLDEAEKQFLGSALRVSPSHLVSCEHCLRAYESRALTSPCRLETMDGIELTILSRDAQWDLVLLYAEGPLPGAAAPVTFQTMLPRRGTRFAVLGYPESHDGKATLQYHPAELLLTGTGDADDSIYDVQFAGGLPSGVSGSPVFIQVGDMWRCFAMAELGRRETQHSRAIGAGALVEFLRDLSIAVEVDNTAPLNEYESGGVESSADAAERSSREKKTLAISCLTALVIDVATCYTLGPPPWIAACAVTSVLLVLSLVLTYRKRDWLGLRVRRTLSTVIGTFVLALVGYSYLMAQYTVKPLADRPRIVKGYSLKTETEKLLQGASMGTPDEVLEAYQYDATKVWTPGSIYAVQTLLMASWAMLIVSAGLAVSCVILSRSVTAGSH